MGKWWIERYINIIIIIIISFFVPEIFKFSYYANLVADDVIGCASTVA